VRPEIKFAAIERYQDKYPIRTMCSFFQVSRSGYYAYLGRTESTTDASLVQLIRQCQEETDRTYGYRRIGLWLDRRGNHVNHKRIYRIMQKFGLFSEVRRKRKYQQMSDQLHRYPNLLNREFSAKRPNEKWVTDISYIGTKQGLYIFRSFEICLTIASLPTKLERSKQSILFSKRFVVHREKKRSPQSYSSTATKGFNTLHRHTSP